MSSRTDLYRHYDDDGKLLYVGISLSAVSRLSEHVSGSPWAARIARVDIESFGSRYAAAEAERKAIIKEKPLWNLTHNGNNERRIRRPKKDEKPIHHAYMPPPADEDDVWLRIRQVESIVKSGSLEWRERGHAAQRVIFLQDGTVRGGERYWKLSDLERSGWIRAWPPIPDFRNNNRA